MSYKDYESLAAGTQIPLSSALDQLKWNSAGLVPAIAQQHDSGEVLMLAWMNRAALEETLATGQVCYWSRSRQSYWRKGESSGHRQRLVALRIDCDGDAVLLLVDQQGPACHTLRRNCFYLEVQTPHLTVISNPE